MIDILQAHKQGVTVHYGNNKPYVGKETDFQQSAMSLIRLKYDNFAYHCPNGGKREKKKDPKTGKCYSQSAQRLKREGVLEGVSDVLIDFPQQGYHGARIELKVNGGKLSDAQKSYLAIVAARGYFTAVCWSIDGFIACLKNYFQK